MVKSNLKDSEIAPAFDIERLDNSIAEAALRLSNFGTFFTFPSKIKWTPQPGFPPFSLENGVLSGDLNGTGLYLTLVKWYPGFMSAPHMYLTDRLCVVISGKWWINSGTEFDPGSSIAMPPGSFVRRAAHTPHYDGVLPEAEVPAVVAICGMAPVGARLVDPNSVGWRKVSA